MLDDPFEPRREATSGPPRFSDAGLKTWTCGYQRRHHPDGP